MRFAHAFAIILGLTFVSSAMPAATAAVERPVKKHVEKINPAILKKYDTNQDGQLDENERVLMKNDMDAAKARQWDRTLKQYDANGNGKLDEDELAALEKDEAAKKAKAKAQAEELLKKYDANGDGKLDAAEKDAMREDAKKKKP
ncbi:MAG: EF-hand domain-containing protein [Verrucomicrobia bacterium]|nr:EF-hand domain-containing protein [Verrucomicrobiota bacterium]